MIEQIKIARVKLQSVQTNNEIDQLRTVLETTSTAKVLDIDAKELLRNVENSGKEYDDLKLKSNQDIAIVDYLIF